MSKIPLESLIPHGNITTRIEDNILKLNTLSSITSIAYNLTGNTYKRHFIELPLKAHLPFSLSATIKINYPGLILLIGEGHVLFNCPSNRSLEDIVKPTDKPFLDEHKFNNHLPINSFVNIQINYGLKEMQILINNKEALYSIKQPYMKAKELAELNQAGFRIGLEISKLSTLWIKKIEINELNNEPFVRYDAYCPESYFLKTNYNVSNVKAPFELFISRFSNLIQKDMIEVDTLLKSFATLKIKRSVDSGGDKLTYNATNFGISYIVRYMGEESWHYFSFYVVTGGKAETWHRKADYMEEVLEEISKSDQDLASRIFNKLNDCVSCYGSRCIVKTLYNFQGKKKLACHGVVMLRLCHEDFDDVMSFFKHLEILVQRKAKEGTLQTEKILLLKK